MRARSWRTVITAVGCSAALAVASLAGVHGTAASAQGKVAYVNLYVPNGGVAIPAMAEVPETIAPYLNQQLALVDIDNAAFDSLIKVNHKNKFVPDLASKWKSNKAGTVWTFTLNPKAKWQDGVPVTAKDVAFTYKLVTNSAFPATGINWAPYVKSVTATGKYTVVVKLKSVYAPFLRFYGESYILPQHILGKMSPAAVRTDVNWSRTPLGSGPFKITQYVAGDHITETANPSYFLGAPHLKQIIFRIVPSATTAADQMRTGEVNMMFNDSNISAQIYDQLKSVPSLKGYVTPTFSWSHVDLIETGFFKDVKVRQALETDTPKAKIISNVELGFGTPQYSDQAPARKGYYNKAVTKYWNYSPAKAAQMLAADGFKKNSSGVLEKNGTPFNITFYILSGAPSESATAEVMKQAWGSLGIGVTIKAEESATLFGPGGPLYDPNRLSASDMKAVLYGWITGPDPDDSFFWGCDQIVSKTVKSGGNFVGYCNKQVNKLVHEGLTTINVKKREQIYQKAQLLLARDVPTIWLFWQKGLWLASNKMGNFYPTPYINGITYNSAQWYMGP